MFRVEREIEARQGLGEPSPPGLDHGIQGLRVTERDEGLPLRRTLLVGLQPLEVGDRRVEVGRRWWGRLPDRHVDRRGPLRGGDAIEQRGGEVSQREGWPLRVVEGHAGGAVVRGQEGGGIIAPAGGDPRGNGEQVKGDVRFRGGGRVVVAAATPVRERGVGQRADLGAGLVDLVVNAAGAGRGRRGQSAQRTAGAGQVIVDKPSANVAPLQTHRGFSHPGGGGTRSPPGSRRGYPYCRRPGRHRRQRRPLTGLPVSTVPYRRARHPRAKCNL